LHVSSLREYGDTIARLDHFFEVHKAGLGPKQPSSITARRVKLSAWKAYCNQLATEAEQAKARIAELLPLEQAAAAELARLRSFYVPQ
jgi:hypothetical protein